MPCLRPFQPISCRYKASKWSLRGSLLIETKCYGIDLFRESCSPYIKAIRACLLNTSEICSRGWSPLVWYKFTADLSTTAVMLLFHLKDSFPWPGAQPSSCTFAHTRIALHAHTRPPADPWQSKTRNGTFIPHTHPHLVQTLLWRRWSVKSLVFHLSSFLFNQSTRRPLKPHFASYYLSGTVAYCTPHTPHTHTLVVPLLSRCLSFWLTGVIAWNQSRLLSQLPCQNGIDWCHLLSGTTRSEYTLPCELWACCRHWLLPVSTEALCPVLCLSHANMQQWKTCNPRHTILCPRRWDQSGKHFAWCVYSCLYNAE